MGETTLFKQTSGVNSNQLQHKSPIARSLRDCRLADRSEGRLQPRKASSLTLEGHGEVVTLVLSAPYFLFLSSATFLYFSPQVRDTAKTEETKKSLSWEKLTDMRPRSIKSTA